MNQTWVRHLQIEQQFTNRRKFKKTFKKISNSVEFIFSKKPFRTEHYIPMSSKSAHFGQFIVIFKKSPINRDISKKVAHFVVFFPKIAQVGEKIADSIAICQRD